MLTRILVAINVLVFIWMEATGALNSDQALFDHGALYGPAVFNGQWWRIITSAFMHGGIPHIAFNMFALWQVGTAIESLYGSWRMGIIYFIALIGSGLSEAYFTPNVLTVGASGAIFGLFGALVSAGLRMGPNGRFLIKQSVPIIAINLVLSFALPNISVSGHLGGLVIGFIVALIIPHHFRRQPAPVHEELVPVSVSENAAEPMAVYEPPSYVETHETPPHAPHTP